MARTILQLPVRSLKTHRTFLSTLLISISILLTASTSAPAQVKLPAIFADHMVLQQNSTANIWGWAATGEKITVTASWPGSKTQHAIADSSGEWKVVMPTPSAGGPYTLSVSGTNTVQLSDILIGEVWLCAGQSNMKISLDGYGNNRTILGAIETADFPAIREFFVPRIIAAEPQSDCMGYWHVCTPQTAGAFGAVGFFFGRELHQKLDVPIGLINASWGGTPAEAWTSKETLVKFDAFRGKVEQLKPYTNTDADRRKHQSALQKWEQKLAQLDPGTKENWQNRDLNDADWNTMRLPSFWTGTSLAKKDGIVWFRRTVELPSDWVDKDVELHLGLIDDMDTVWVNGVFIDRTLEWMIPRVYHIPSGTLTPGTNVIAIRVIDPRLGEGGFTGKPEDLYIATIGTKSPARVQIDGFWKYKFSLPTPIPAVPPTEAQKRITQYTPSAIYNGVIQPIIPFRIAGVTWYQGESNCYNPILYRDLFPAMIKDWRKQWGQGNFPFYYAQIAPYLYGHNTCSQAIREAQLLALDKVQGTGMAVLMDIGEKRDIHPKNKWDVGDRLARWALAKHYGQKDIVVSGPLYRGMKVEPGRIRLHFDYVDGGLISKNGPLTDFTIAGADKNFVPATAVIDGDTIIASNPEIKSPVAVRYAWSNWACPNLFNAAGLPASSFRTDDWPLK